MTEPARRYHERTIPICSMPQFTGTFNYYLRCTRVHLLCLYYQLVPFKSLADCRRVTGIHFCHYFKVCYLICYLEWTDDFPNYELLGNYQPSLRTYIKQQRRNINWIKSMGAGRSVGDKTRGIVEYLAACQARVRGRQLSQASVDEKIRILRRALPLIL